VKLEFEDGEQGYHEARELRDLVRFVQENTVAGSLDRQLLDTIESRCIEHMQQRRFDSLRAQEPPAPPARPPLQRLLGWLRSVIGPSRRELELSRQRAEALARAARAEHSAFEALAETSRVARERDELAERLAAGGESKDEAGAGRSG